MCYEDKKVGDCASPNFFWPFSEELSLTKGSDTLVSAIMVPVKQKVGYPHGYPAFLIGWATRAKLKIKNV
jgi:hypothetical protein